MRIVHFLTEVRIELGGVARAVLDMTARLAAAGHDVTLLTWDDTDVPADWKQGESPRRPASIRLAQGPMRTLTKPSIAVARQAIAAADVVHLHNPWEPGNIQLAAVARKARVPYILSAHGMLDDWSMAQSRPKKLIFRALGGRALLTRAGAIHLTAQAEHDQARRWFAPAPGVVVPLIMDLEPFRDLPGEAPARSGPLAGLGDGPLVLFLSRIHPKKGIETLLRAIARVREGGVPCALAIAGTGDEAYVRSLKALTDELALAQSVRFTGLVRGTEKLSLYQSADVFALPTHQENFGLVLPEAMACGTPVITTKGVDIWPELESSGGAIITQATPEAFASALTSLLTSPARARSMGQAGRDWVLRELDPARTLERLLAMYAGLRTPA